MKNFTLAKHENFVKWRTETQLILDEASCTRSCYWIVDISAAPGLPDFVQSIGTQHKIHHLYLNTYHEASMKSGPSLIPYTKQNPLNDWLFERVGTSPVGYLIQVEQGSEIELYEHLQNLLECIPPKGGRALFRFYDPRIMYAITTYTDPNLIPRLLGPVIHLNGWEYGRRTAVIAGDGKDHLHRCAGDIHYPNEFLDHIWKEVKIHTLVQLYSEPFSVSHPDATFFEAYDLYEKTYSFLADNEFVDAESFCLAAAFTAMYPGCLWEDEAVIKAFAELPVKSTFAEALGSIGGGSYA